MAHQIVELECPGCGKAITTSTQQCPQCFREIVITTFNSVSGMSPLEINKQANAYRKAMVNNPNDQTLNTSIAFCYLKLKLYDKAIPCFEKAIEDNFDNSETYFYAAIALLGGKKAFLTPRTVINKIEEYIQAALMIEPKGIYYYFWAYIRYDHHFRKSYKMSPNYQELLLQAKKIGLSQTDVAELYKLLEVDRPSVL
jgi:tetratricopeptide (TPR) repeat protein